MLPFRSYRARLVAYTVVLIAFLTLTLVYSSRAAREILLEQADASLLRTIQLLEGHLLAERKELLRYAEVVRGELRLQEYMFIVVQVGSDAEPLRQLYKAQFGWLPVDRYTLISRTGQRLFGAENSDLFEHVKTGPQGEQEGTSYFEGALGTELVATAPVRYLGNTLGVIALTRMYDSRRLGQLKNLSGGELFFVKDGRISMSTMDGVEGQALALRDGMLAVDAEKYRLLPVDMHMAGKGVPQLWFGVSETKLMENLEKHRQLTLALVVVPGLIILGLGLLILRDFNRPLESIIGMTHAIARGDFPAVEKRAARNEIEYLKNQFADMVQSLRDKEAEVDQARLKLQELAITDTLTGLYNRRYLIDVFPKLRAQARRDTKVLSAVLADLDHFKQINDTCGHIAGDRCLEAFAALMRQHSRTNDYLFRMGGEEFLIVSMNDDETGGVALAEKIRDTLQHTLIEVGTLRLKMTVSCGVASVAPDCTDQTTLEHVLQRADHALYAAKDAGRNKVIVYQSHLARAMDA